MTMPIIMVHRGDEDYLQYSLRQASMNNDVILIGKPSNRMYCTEKISHALIADYGGSASEFANVYVHTGPNSYEYNLFCFQRWFIIKDYMKANRLEACWYIDSDVMLYADLQRPEFQRFAFEFCWTTPIKIDMLERFCTFMQSNFSDPLLFKQLETYNEQVKHPAISDMVLSRLYVEKVRGGERTFGIFPDSFFDGNINHPQIVPPHYRIETVDGKKKVFLINGELYCKHSGGGLIKVNSLHFQGRGKVFMKDFLASALPRNEETLCYDYIARQWLPAGT